MEHTKMAFTEDQKAVVEREIKSAYSTLATLLDWVKTDALREDMKETLPNLVDSYMKKVKEIIGFTGEETEQQKEMTKSIGHYYQSQINHLEKALEHQQSMGGITAITQLVFKKLDKWWDIEGFNYIREKQITGGGMVKLELGFMLDSFPSHYSETPVSDKEQLKTKVQYLMDQGFEFTPKKRGHGLDLIDNDKNRRLLEGMIKAAFPSAKVWSYTNHLRTTNQEDDDTFILRGMELTISELSEIEKLAIEEKYFLDEEDE